MKLRSLFAAVHAALFVLLLAVNPAGSGSMLLLGAGGASAGGGGGGRTCADDTASTNFLSRTSGLSNTEKDAYCNLIKGLETDSIITGDLSGATGCGTVLDALYIFATNTTTTANLNICGTSFGLTGATPPSFSADHGYTGNGSTQFLDTNFVPRTSGNFSQDSASIGAYVITSRTTGADYCEIGTNGGSNALDIFPWYIDGFLYNEMNANAALNIAHPANAQGMYVGSRTAASGAGAVVTYRNGTSFNSASTTSIPTDTHNIFIGADDQAGTASDFSADQLSAAFIGSGLNATQAGNISTRINAYMTALGINVY